MSFESYMEYKDIKQEIASDIMSVTLKMNRLTFYSRK